MCRLKKMAICKQVIYDCFWFKEEMLKRWKKEIGLNEIGYEFIMLAPDEIDEELIPLHEIESLPIHCWHILSSTLKMKEMNGFAAKLFV